MWKYGSDVEIRNSVGKIIAVRERGYGQGDSLAGFCYDISSKGIKHSTQRRRGPLK
jgi:hypothetical protein